jgi:ADP-heptose:LPS heptosyltransferase
MIQIKYTKNIDNFIVRILPYLEVYLNENTREVITLYATGIICDIVDIMFSKYINTRKIKHNVSVVNNGTLELDTFLSLYYDLDKIIPISKPLCSQNMQHLKLKKFICIHPKYKPTEAFHNINQNTLNTLIERNKLDNEEIYIIGDEFERLNTKIGKDINNFFDTLSHLQHCKLFITSESHWHYIALLCNCRNVIVYSSTYPPQLLDNEVSIISKTSEKGTSNVITQYNPFNNSVYITNNLSCDKISGFIRTILDN